MTSEAICCGNTMHGTFTASEMKRQSTSKHAAGERISRAYEQIFEMIVYGRLPPGARIAEGPLAKMLGVSRTPVRESLQRLRREGLLIEVGGGSGLRGRLAVAPLERERMEELYALAGAIEALGVRGLSKVGAAQREALARRLEKIESAFHAEARRRTPEYDRLFELHHAFHSALVEAAAGPETRAVLRTIRPQLDRYEWFYAPMAGPDFTPTRREHAAIVDAVRHGSSHELERAVRANWLNAAQRLGPLIERFDGRLPAGAPVFSVSGNLAKRRFDEVVRNGAKHHH
jgi:DNA-binding GntR family transcriptional regulator